MPSPSIHQFLDAAQRSGLVSPDEVGKITQLSVDATPTAEAIAAQLVDRKLLTTFQAELLLTGRGADCVLAGRYRILEKIGAGGMGAVYKALDTKLDRAVAIKVMAPQHVDNPDAVTRFHREARALAKVSHPAIVQAHDAGEDQGRHFLVMEFVDGADLTQLLRQHGRLAPHQAADYVYQAAVGMDHAHERGLIHRDLKPSNLLVTPRGQVKILDLGLARFVQDQLGDGQLTREGAGMGTPDYMAPEQFTNAHRADHRADVYALGCTLYQLLTGKVPFPGTSLSEKAHAHETKEPPAIEEFCPEAGAGLVLVVQRALAKRPEDRFQSAGQLAEALSLYVGGSSAALPKLKATTSWEGSQLSFVATPATTNSLPERPKKSRRAGLMLGAAATVALALLFWPLAMWLFRDPEGGVGRSGNPETIPIASNDPHLLTVSKESGDGGQFRTIGAALKQAAPRMTIRVLDSANYHESVHIDEPARHTGLTLEAMRGATLVMPPGEQYALRISKVPEVTIRGIQFGTGESTPTPQPGMVPSFILVESRSPGVVLEDLVMKSSRPICGIQLHNLGLSEAEAPIVVRHCLLKVGYCGILVSGRAGFPASGVLIHGNRIEGGAKGIGIELGCQRTQVVGNVIRDASMAGLEIRSLQPVSSDILIANNTLFGGAFGVRVWSDPPHVDLVKNQVAFRNNVIQSASVCDLVYVRFDPTKVSNGDESGFLLDLWRFDHNWRDLAGEPRVQITPLATQDRKLDGNPFVSLEGADPDFLRPTKDSPLATEGAGKTDPRLPSYVGAVPPEGVSPWDWDRAWKMPADARLLTVSKETKDGGEFRTINDAIKKAMPWSTVRVLDDAAYEETVNMQGIERFRGVTLDSPRQATIRPPLGATAGLMLGGLSDVAVRGLRIVGNRPRMMCAVVMGSCSNVTLSNLEFICDAPETTAGLLIQDAVAQAEAGPVIVENCRFSGGLGCIQVFGLDTVSRLARPVGKLIIRNNQVHDGVHGIVLAGRLNDIQIVGNQVWSCGTPLAFPLDLLEGSANVLIANNTLKGTGQCLRIGDVADNVGRIAIRNNLILSDGTVDVAFLGKNRAPLTRFQIDYNWRQVRPPPPGSSEATNWIDGEGDQLREKIALLSMDAASEDFLRPAADSPLSTGGAGKDDPSLPTYVGAIPPKGTPAWDWNKTWRWRMTKAAAPAKAAEKP